jgi:hypothetical protein
MGRSDGLWKVFAMAVMLQAQSRLVVLSIGCSGLDVMGGEVWLRVVIR